MNIANKLTILRVLMIPFFVASFYLPWVYWYYVSAAIFLVAYATDMLDGHLARSRNMVTDFGKFMDPIADKLLSMSALVMLSAFGQLSPIITIIILAREFIVSGLRLVAVGQGKVIPAGWLGKAKTMLQFIMLLLLLLRPMLDNIMGVTASTVLVWIFIAAATILTIWSGVDYIMQNRKFINPRE